MNIILLLFEIAEYKIYYWRFIMYIIGLVGATVKNVKLPIIWQRGDNTDWLLSNSNIICDKAHNENTIKLRCISVYDKAESIVTQDDIKSMYFNSSYMIIPQLQYFIFKANASINFDNFLRCLYSDYNFRVVSEGILFDNMWWYPFVGLDKGIVLRNISKLRMLG